jgi:hypothetical protein
MRLRPRDIPFLMLEVACWVWLLACLFLFIAFGYVTVKQGNVYDGPNLVFPLVAAVPALWGMWKIARYFNRRRSEEQDVPGFEVLLPPSAQGRDCSEVRR